MDKEQTKKILEKQGYKIIGKNSAVKICRWTKKSLLDEGCCYKSKFYGIDSWRCCQISPWIACQNKCIHCWRPIEFDFDKLFNKKTEVDNPKKIIKECINVQRKLISGFKGNLKVNKKKFKEAQEPMQFAISLIGEPTIYPKLGELIKELRKQGKTSFLVTNGLRPSVLSRLDKGRNLPTQLYLSLNSSNEKDYNKWHRSSEKNAWEKFNKTLELFPKLKTRKVIRMTLVKGINSNMKNEMIKDYAGLIKKAVPDWLEIKGFMSVGFSRKRRGMSYDAMPTHKEIKDYAKKISYELNNQGLKDYKILDEHEFSRVVLVGEDTKKMKITEEEI